jgi:uncharacterized membrane protein
VTASVDPSEITLAPGEVRDASSSQPVVVTLNQNLVSTTLFTLGIYWPAANNEITYTTGLIAPAIATYAEGRANDVATTSGPLADLTWREIAQGITNLFAASQSTVYNGNRRGGWRYYPGQGDSDASTTQWAVIAMIYDEILGATTPQFVKDELQYWLSAIQYLNPNRPDVHGVACYQPGIGPCDHSDTGGPLLGLNFVGASLSDLSATCGEPDDSPGSGICNWWEDYNRWLVNNQNPDGSWNGAAYWTGPLATAFNLSILAPACVPTRDITVELYFQLPDTGYVVEPDSVNPQAETVSASEVVWSGRLPFNDPSPQQFQLTGEVLDLAPGESREISLGTELMVTITDNGQPVTTTIALPPVAVAAAHLLALPFALQTVARGEQAVYSVQLLNPFTTAETFTLTSVGLDDLGVDLAPSLIVPAGETISTSLTVTVPADAIEEERMFSVVAETASGVLDTVEGRLTIAGDPNLPPPVSPETRAATVTLTPAQGVAGQGTAATYRVIVTNVGDEADTYALSGTFPAGVAADFAAPTVTVLPGLENFYEVLLTLTPAPGTAAGSYSFTVSATSTTQPSVSPEASGTSTVVGNGVQVGIDPISGLPGSTFTLTVANTGLTEDTFDLTLGGPLALFATLEMETVTLAPGAAETVLLSLDTINFARAGELPLVVLATSQAEPAVQDDATAQIQIAPRQGLSVAFEPASVTLESPEAARSLLVVSNTGNIEGTYSATITGTSGPVAASLTDPQGQPSTAIDTFHLPGLGTGAILVDGNLTAYGSGAVTVEVSALDGSGPTESATLYLETVNQPPVAAAGADQNVETGTFVRLDGTESYDPDGQLITYDWSLEWSIDAVPAASNLTDDAVESRTSPIPSFVPDVDGIYRVQLVVNDGYENSAPDYVEIIATTQNVPPNANAGADQNTSLGYLVSLVRSQQQ